MSNVPDSTERWLPQSPADRELVLGELEAILSSPHFRISKRYPALLNYVVRKTLDGHADKLKERTLGVEVFDRKPDYDTNADPVVRFSAGEVRKRIAQFYHELGSEPPLQIHLPLGSYVPEFKLRPHSQTIAHPTPTHPEEQGSSATAIGAVEWHANPAPALTLRRKAHLLFRRPFFWPALLMMIFAFTAVYVLHGRAATTIADGIWRPVLKAPGTVQIVINTIQHDVPSPPNQANDVRAADLHGAYHRISVCDAVAVSHLASVLGNHSKPYVIKEADRTSLEDIRERSVILIGAYNNLWTMRLMEPLRFHFVTEGHGVRIVDAQAPNRTGWVVDYSKDYPSAVSDYAIVARYVDPTTNGSILIIAGIGAYGTEAASEAVANPYDLKKLLTAVPSGWESRNLEFVIRTTVINGENGPPDLVSFATW